MYNMLQLTADGLSNAFARDQKTPEDLIFELFKIPNKNEASIGKLLTVLKSYGLQESDPRLKPMMDRIWKIEKMKEEVSNEAKDPKHWKLSREDFKLCINESLTLISRTLQNNLIIPSWQQFCTIIKAIYEHVCLITFKISSGAKITSKSIYFKSLKFTRTQKPTIYEYLYGDQK